MEVNRPSSKHGGLRFGVASLGLAISLGCVSMVATASDDHWVATWGCAPQLTEPHNLPPAPGLGSNTLRQVVHVSIGGKRLRANFSNAYGTNTITLNSVRVARSAGGSAIVPSTDTALSFHGSPSVDIPAGGTAMSDPFQFDLSPLSSLAVSISFGTLSGDVTGHPGSRATSYLQAGNEVSAAGMPAAVKTAHWYILTAVEALAASNSMAVVALGDSITDGRGSTTDGNDRWPDFLARRLFTNAPTASVAVVNQGIGGNAVLSRGLGPSATSRFDRDVLGTSGARWLILFEGVNDIGASTSSGVSNGLIQAYGQFIESAHAHGMRVYGATITPFGRNSYYSRSHEEIRQTVNDWIRTSGRFDAVLDFDAVVRDPNAPTNLLTAYDTGDHLHLRPAGYRAMAESINLALFQP